VGVIAQDLNKKKLKRMAKRTYYREINQVLPFFVDKKYNRTQDNPQNYYFQNISLSFFL